MQLKTHLSYISSLDLLRGLAALAVVFFHFTHGNPDFLTQENILYVIGRYGFLGVDVFFVISGFVIPYSMYVGKYKTASFGKFMVKRIARIEPPYIISIVLVIALNYLSTLSPLYRGAGFEVNTTGLLLHLGYLNAFFHYPWVNDVYWTLAIEFQYYLIIAALFPLLISKKKSKSFLVLLFLAISGIFVNEHSLFFNYAHLFIVGILLFQFKIGYLTKGEFGTMLLIVLMLIFIKFDKRYLIAALLPYFFIMYFDLSNKISKFLGDISYSLYLVHIPIGGRVINIAETLFTNEMVRSLFVFVAMAVSIFAAWIFYKLVEKPSIRLSKRLSYSKKKTE